MRIDNTMECPECEGTFEIHKKKLILAGVSIPLFKCDKCSKIFLIENRLTYRERVDLEIANGKTRGQWRIEDEEE